MSPFSIRIFVADGDPDGLRLVERSNWIGKAVIFPRTLLPKIKQRDEFSQTGVYLLLGPRPDGEGEMLYVGEGDLRQQPLSALLMPVSLVSPATSKRIVTQLGKTAAISSILLLTKG